MSIQVRRESPSLLTELTNWMGATALDPQVRVEEWVEGDRRIIRADIPGVDPQRDIQLSVDGGMLHLRGERRAEKRERHRTEIRYGSFARVIPLPPGTRAQDISADYVDGVLTVSMPETTGSEAETIPVTTGSKKSEKG
ncbi:Hsp20/alpha crystallin family protein [Nocardioides dongkuii]|uniref:Hsp20/alpha crystallin family protein n=1 Tax=Nocardioides dongkuii TaxID=2760089 RepID=UPI00187833CD|nr:Hsp20/alpha crystallin family protein [Nocardioides dongkuii]